MVTRYPIAYIRRSYADASSTGDVSREVQEQAIRDLAHRDGHNGDVEYFVDWSKSASEAKSSTRTAYHKMVARIEAGEVSTVYAYALDRLNRSLMMSARFAKACEDHDVRIVTFREGEVRQDSPSEWLRWTILATFGEYELRTITARNTHAIAERRSKGGWIGRVGIGWKLERNADNVVVKVPDPEHPIEHILEAVREAGSILGAAKLLNARGVPTPDGKHVWGSTTLGRIVRDNAPELMPAPGPTGRRQPSRSSALAQLLVCHCGLAEDPPQYRVLTPEPGRKGYRCVRGNRQGGAVHGRSWISESMLMPWIQAEAARLEIPADTVVGVMEGIDAKRGALEARMERAHELYIAGHIGRARHDREAATVTSALEGLAEPATVARIAPVIDWTLSPAAVNEALRSMWRSVQLGPDLMPVSASWIVGEWRAA